MKSKAIPFIIFDEKKGFVITEESKEFLQTLKNVKLGIISIIGKYRTGKSYFINKILLDLKKEEGFKIGQTTNACTRGIWIWNKTIKKENSDIEYLVCDTEGLGSVNENSNHDTRIFLFALLLSSYLIYNSQGAINENALNNIFLIINIAKDIKVKSDNDNPSDYFPSFLWVLRDFTLKLVDENNYEITSKQYLENVLKLSNLISDKEESKNKIKRMIKQYFKERDCFTMIRPTENEENLRKLISLGDNELRPQFFKQVKFIRDRIYKKVKPKKLNDKYIDGPSLLKLAEVYKETINKGNVVKIKNAWVYICNSENEKITNELIYKFKNKLWEDIYNLNEDKINLYKDNLFLELRNQFVKVNEDEEEKEFKEVKVNLENQLNSEIKSIWNKYETEIKKKSISFLEDNFIQIKHEIFNNFEKYENLENFDELFKPIELEFIKKFNLKNDWKDEIMEQFKSKKIKKIMDWMYTQKNTKERLIKDNYEQKIVKIKEEAVNNKKIYKEKERKLVKKHTELIKNKENIQFDFKKEIDELKEKLENSQFKLSNFENENNTLKKENKDLKKEKDNLIIKQKSILNKNLVDLEKKYDLKAQELKYILEENTVYKNKIENYIKEVTNLKSYNLVLNKEKEDLNKQLKSLNRDKQPKNKDYTLIEKKYNELLNENSVLKSKYKLIKEEFKESKSVNNNLLHTISNKIINLESSNRNIGNKSDRNMKVDEKKFKYLKKIVKYSSAMTCSNCNNVIKNPLFGNHLEFCLPKFAKRGSNLFNEDISFKIIRNHIFEDEDTGMPNCIYTIEINNKNFKLNTNKSMKNFINFIDSIKNDNKLTNLPNSISKIDDMWNLENILEGKTYSIQDRISLLEIFWNEIILIKEIRNTKYFEEFIKFK